MPQYQCKLISSEGTITNDLIEASSSRDLRSTVSRQNIFPLSVKKVRKPLFENGFNNLFYSVKPQDLENFTSQLAVMVKAGVPLIKSLGAISSQVESPGLKKVIENVIERINKGEVLSKALSKHPKVFNYLYENMIKVGETTGSLDEILVHIRDFLHWDIAIRRKVKAAMRYPAIVVTILIIAFALALGFIIPQFAALFASANVTLPLPTRMMIFLSDVIRNYWFTTSIITLSVIALIRLYTRRPGGAYRFDKIKLMIPVFKDITKMSTIARFAHILETLNRSGVSIVQSLKICEKTLGNRVIAKDVSVAREQVIQGVSLANALSNSKYIPPMTKMMIDTGEQSGALDDMLHNIAEQYDSVVKDKIEGLAGAIEPILTILIGGFLLVFALSIFLPMWNLIDVIQ